MNVRKFIKPVAALGTTLTLAGFLVKDSVREWQAKGTADYNMNVEIGRGDPGDFSQQRIEGYEKESIRHWQIAYAEDLGAAAAAGLGVWAARRPRKPKLRSARHPERN